MYFLTRSKYHRNIIVWLFEQNHIVIFLSAVKSLLEILPLSLIDCKTFWLSEFVVIYYFACARTKDYVSFFIMVCLICVKMELSSADAHTKVLQ